MTVKVEMKDLLEAGVHYGHQAKRWNPKMKPYIFGARNGIHIIDLQKTVKLFQSACTFLEGTTAKGGHVLFVGTKRMARDLVQIEAKRAGMFYITHRWLGGTLTNFQTIRQSIHRLKRIEKMSQDGTYDKLPKKEVLMMEREREKLERNLGGIKDMPGMPRAIFVVDAHKETIALLEARRLGIPVVAVADTNADPDGIDFIIPGNDDSMKSLKLFIGTVADACLYGKTKGRDKSELDDGQAAEVKTGSFRDDSGKSVSVSKKKTFA
ncbi:MAG: 30S ribosomal protein S2 [Proteobacteria bacterium]|nr:30S ribosomal protein S2 [Pseudomonadota bacterium]